MKCVKLIITILDVKKQTDVLIVSNLVASFIEMKVSIQLLMLLLCIRRFRCPGVGGPPKFSSLYFHALRTLTTIYAIAMH